MKKAVEFKLCGKSASIEFNIMRLAKFEKALGHSLFYIMSTNGILRSMDINFTIAGLAYGLEKELTLEEAADTIQKHCDEGAFSMISMTQSIGGLLLPAFLSRPQQRKRQKSKEL